VKTGEIYTVIGEILRLSHGYSRDTLENALDYARSHLPPGEREVVAATLSAWLNQKGPAIGAASAAAADEPSQTQLFDDSDPRTREVHAMLSDPVFVPGKAELVKRLAQFFGEAMVVNPQGKESYKRLVARAVGAFARAPSKVQAQIYRAMRRAYLPKQGASLEGWSKIIRDDEP